jgi:hypothetical protein
MTAIHPDLLMFQKFAYGPCELTLSHFKPELESLEYEASTFEINHRCVQFRSGKITPTKSGQFVTFWKRIGKGPIMPFDMEDPFDLFVVNVRHGAHLGQFVFPKSVLVEKGIVSKLGKGGKRAMRIYPSWCIPDNSQAQKTQAWQLLYFFEFPLNQEIDCAKIRKLFL